MTWSLLSPTLASLSSNSASIFWAELQPSMLRIHLSASALNLLLPLNTAARAIFTKVSQTLPLCMAQQSQRPPCGYNSLHDLTSSPTLFLSLLPMFSCWPLTFPRTGPLHLAFSLHLSLFLLTEDFVALSPLTLLSFSSQYLPLSDLPLYTDLVIAFLFVSVTRT